MIETLVGPFIAFILFIMPMYAIGRLSGLKKFYRTYEFAFVMITGLIAISAIFYGIACTFRA